MGEMSTRPPLAEGEEERRKAIFTALRGGTSILFWDNLQGEINSQALAVALTASIFTDRILGRSEEWAVPVQASIVFTGNNPSFSKELRRRLSLCRLDAKVAHPESRDGFRHADLQAWVLENRGDLIWAFLTLATHWIASGQPEPKTPPLASYPSWTRVIGGILECAGFEGFQENRDDINQFADAGDEEEITIFLQQWWDDARERQIGKNLTDRLVGGKDGLIAMCGAYDITMPVPLKRQPGSDYDYDAAAFGRYLKRFNGRVFELVNGKQVEVRQNPQRSKRGAQWSRVVAGEAKAELKAVA